MLNLHGRIHSFLKEHYSNTKIIYCLSFNLRRVSNKRCLLIRTACRGDHLIRNTNIQQKSINQRRKLECVSNFLFGRVALVIGIFDKGPIHFLKWLEQVIISPYCYCLNYSFKQKPLNDSVTRETSFSFPWRIQHWMRRDCYFLIRFAQTKITSSFHFEYSPVKK